MAKALLIPTAMEETAEELCEDIDPEEALPKVEQRVQNRFECIWSWVDVIVEDGERFSTSAGAPPL